MNLTDFYVHRLVTFDALAYLFRLDKQYIHAVQGGVSLSCCYWAVVNPGVNISRSLHLLMSTEDLKIFWWTNIGFIYLSLILDYISLHWMSTRSRFTCTVVHMITTIGKCLEIFMNYIITWLPGTSSIHSLLWIVLHHYVEINPIITIQLIWIPRTLLQ